jgi:hypothetical protein
MLTTKCLTCSQVFVMKDNILTTLDDVTRKRASQARPIAQILNQIPEEIIEKPVSETFIKDNSTQQVILQMLGLGILALLVLLGIDYYKDDKTTIQQANNTEDIAIENKSAYPIYGIKIYRLGGMTLKPIKYLTVEGDNLIPVGLGENYNETMARWQATIQSMYDISITATDKVALVSVKLKDDELKLELKRSGDVYTASKGDLRFIVKFLSDKRFQYVMANKNTKDGFMIDSKSFNPSTGKE